ncbi:MAG TPA: hypothetical protein PLX35_16460 [Cyclobacteriaceae bacterium]|nr:hypothetical protein [Cyclobacteriaceae bacterium]
MKLFTVATCLVLYVLSSCASFESVTATGKLAESLDTKAHLFDTNPCDFLVEFKPQLIDCNKSRGYDTIRKKGIKLIVAYGKALQSIAKESDLKPADQIELVIKGANNAGWTSLTDNQLKGSKNVGAAVIDLISKSIKQKGLSKVVRSTDPDIQTIVQQLNGILTERANAYKEIQKTIDELFYDDNPRLNLSREVKDQSDKVIAYAENNSLDKLLVKQLKIGIKDQLEAIDQEKKLIAAFAKSHKLLAENFTKIGTKEDASLVKKIFEDLGNLFDGAEKLKPVSTPEK